MKQVLIAAALSTGFALTASPVASSPKLEAPPVAGRPVLVLEQTTHEAGVVLKGEVVVAEFLLRNAGTANLEILSVKPACGCTTPDHDKVVPPGGSGRIVLRVDTERFGAGPLRKTASVKTNDPTQPTLVLAVETEVTTLVDVLPRDTVTFRHHRGEKKPQTLTIRSNTEELMRIRDVEVANEAIRHRLTQVPATTPGTGSEWSLELWLDEATEAGDLSTSVKLLTSSARVPIIPITVRGTVLGQVNVNPSTVYFRVDGKEKAQKVLTVNHRAATEFKLVSSELQAAKIDAAAIEIETEVIRDGSSYRVIVHYAGGLEPGNYTGKVVLGTSDADEPTLEVPLYIVVT